MAPIVERLGQVNTEEFMLLYFGVPAIVAVILLIGWNLFGDK